MPPSAAIDSPTPPVKRRRKHATRSRSGCLTCRTRRKRCDGARPSCGACSRLNLDCKFEGAKCITGRVVSDVPDVPNLPNVSSPTILEEPPMFLADATFDEAFEGRRMLSYYVREFVPAISVAVTPASFYTSLYVPMAFSSDGVLNALIASAALHSARTASTAQQVAHYHDLSDRFAKKCYSFLQQRISLAGQPLKEPYEVSAVTLLLVGREAVSASGSRKWLSQVTCVRNLLTQLSRNRGASWELHCLKRHFTYHDIMASLMNNVGSETTAVPISSMAEDQGINETSPRLDNAIPDSSIDVDNNIDVDPLMGLSKDLFALIRRIQRAPPFASTETATSTPWFQQVEGEIRAHEVEKPLHSSNLSTECTLDLVALTEVYRLTALILLYRKADRRHQLLPVLATRTIGMLGRIPRGSAAEAGFTAPLFLAGCELTQQADREICLFRLKATEVKYRFQNICRVESVLEEVWQSKADDQPGRDWEDILRERQWFISLS